MNENKITKIYAVPHFHYDVEWWKTKDEYNDDVEKIIDRALELLDSEPEFTYIIDQALALKPYWDKHPEKHDTIRGFIKEGRLELVGGTWSSPDENIPTGEALIRQQVYGARFVEDVVGGEVGAGWQIDAFGHPAQYPQIISGCGLKGFVFARGVQNWRDPSAPIQFLWEAPDGSRLPTNWFAAHYPGFMNIAGSRINRKLFETELKGRIAYEGDRAACDMLMMPLGSDFWVPTDEWISFAQKWNASGEGPEMKFELPSRFFERMEKEFSGCIPTVKGEFNPLLTGCYESREKVKKGCRRSQSAIIDAEKWATVAWLQYGREYPSAALDSAWELLLENDFHDIVCGTGTDRVYANTIARYEEAMETISAVSADARKAIANEAPAKGGGAQVVVFNSLNWPREEIVSIGVDELGLDPGAAQYEAHGPDGGIAPCQIQGGRAMFAATAPSVGYATYKIKKAGAKKKTKSALRIDGCSMENEYLRVELDPMSGCVLSIYDKEAGCETLDVSRWFGNELVVEEDAGNLWTVLKTGRTWEGKNYASNVNIIERGPVRVGFESKGRQKNITRRQRVYLTAGSRRVDFETDIDFKGKDRRVKVMFAPADGGSAVIETPFYSQPRGDGHHCAQTWTDISDGRRGLAAFNDGNPGTDIEDGAIGIVLFRSLCVASSALLRYVAKERGKIFRGIVEAAGLLGKGLNSGMAEWALYDVHGLLLREWSSPGVEVAKGTGTLADHLLPWLRLNEKSDTWEWGAHSFRYAVYPHAGGWKEARLSQRGLEFNSPLNYVVQGAGGGKGDSSKSFFESTGDGAILVALKKAEKSDAAAARIYDSTGDGCALSFSLAGDAKNCRMTNMVEKEAGKKLRRGKTGFTARLEPWRIQTFVIE